MQLNLIQCDACKCHSDNLGARTLSKDASDVEAIASAQEERSVVVRFATTGLPAGWSQFAAGFSDGIPIRIDVCPECRSRLESALGSVLGPESDTESTLPLFSIEEIERRHILAVLTSAQGNKSRAARILGIERSTLDRKLKKYGMAPSPEPAPV